LEYQVAFIAAGSSIKELVVTGFITLRALAVTKEEDLAFQVVFALQFAPLPQYQSLRTSH